MPKTYFDIVEAILHIEDLEDVQYCEAAIEFAPLPDYEHDQLRHLCWKFRVLNDWPTVDDEEDDEDDDAE